MNVSKDIRYIGVDDHQVDLFEGHFDVPLGMAYFFGQSLQAFQRMV